MWVAGLNEEAREAVKDKYEEIGAKLLDEAKEYKKSVRDMFR